MIDRRAFLGSAAAASLLLPGEARANHSSLDGLARRGGLRFGSCLGGTPANAPSPSGSFADPRYRTLVAAQCGLMTPENELKWAATRPSADRFDFRAADALIDWAVAHDIEPRGHTLLWHREERFPAWVAAHDFGSSPHVEAERLLTEHVRTIAGRYANRIHSFDVVNETVDSETGVLRETTLSKAFGGTLDLVDRAFRIAREAAPHAELVYNDYMSWEPGFETHRAGVLRLLEALRKRGTPVDTLGVQSHIGAGPEHVEAPFGGRQDAGWRHFLDEVTGMGFRLLITEFDVDDRALPPDPALRDQAVADYARAYCDLMFDYPQLTGFVAWGLVDRYSWLQHFRPRSDGAPKRPNSYDDAFRPKPLHNALAAAFHDRRK
jgi:endo-1,4-beta-xylanase